MLIASPGHRSPYREPSHDAHTSTGPSPTPYHLVFDQLITDEVHPRAVEPELLYEFGAMVLCAPHAQLVGLAVDAFQPLVHLEHFAEQCFGAFPNLSNSA
jgi:hypothetical protein